MSMDDAISRKAAFDACFNMWNKDYKEIAEDIRKLPPVTTAPQLGHWIHQRIPMPLSDTFKDCVVCSCCLSHDDYSTKYCPNCGAKMEV